MIFTNFPYALFKHIKIPYAYCGTSLMIDPHHIPILSPLPLKKIKGVFRLTTCLFFLTG